MNLYTTCPKCGAVRTEITVAGKIKRHRTPGGHWRGPPCDAAASILPAEAFDAAIAAAIAERRDAAIRSAHAIEAERATVEARFAQWEARNAERAKEIAALEKLAAKRAKGGAK